MSRGGDVDEAQRERALGAWELVVHDAPTRTVMAAIRRVLRVKRFADRHGRWLTASRGDIAAAKRWFDRHGAAACFFCRLVPGVRSLISIPAGIARMPLPAFLAYTAAGAAVWTTLLACAGYFVRSRFEQVGEYLDPASWVAFGAIAAVYLYRVARHKGEPQ